MLDSLSLYRQRFDLLLEAELDRLGAPSLLTEACEYSLQGGGKRIRPALVFMMAEALGHGLDVGPAALCAEYHHTASLIADDMPCMDDDDERRGRPSCHIAFGETTALLASFGLISAGFEQIAVNGERMALAPEPFRQTADRATRLALECVSRNTGLRGLIGGQFLDLFPPSPSAEVLRQTMHLKTATLFEISFVLGWLFGGGEISEGRLEQVCRLSAHFGMMFQIVDDLYDAPEDRLAERAINAALLLGEEECLEWLMAEAAGFFKELSLLPIQSRLFESIGQELVAMGNQAVPLVFC
jgi:geranylgeranyl diphosphate synthase, type II